MGVTKVSSPCFAIRDQGLVPRSRDPGGVIEPMTGMGGQGPGYCAET